MKVSLTHLVAGTLLLFAAPAFAADTPAAGVPDLPGITTPDRTPNGCVDCHRKDPEGKFDARLTTYMAGWREGVSPKLLAKAQAAAPEGAKLSGKHPDAASMIDVIPTDCLKCHAGNSKLAPTFKKMLHTIHLTGGSSFLTTYNGTCTNCHKLDQKTGAWTLGTGRENP
jgi:cytochrome c5